MVALKDAPAVTTTAPDFAEIYRQHAPTIVRYLHRRLGDDACEDAAAETFARAWQRRASLRDLDGALPWLYTIAGHVVSERWRTERRRLKALERAVAAQRTATPAESDHSVSTSMIAALRRLPAADRDALLLVAWGELSYDETARALNVPTGTVRSRISRARTRLGIDLADLNPTAHD